MRSYYEHLRQTAITPEKRPIFRSSAIFPVFKQDGISCRIIFLGYWLLKRHITDITAIVTLRSTEGEILVRNVFEISEPIAYRIELDDLLQHIKLQHSTFHGSIEVEFHSSKNMVFPFPAVSINYFGPAFSSVVHSAQRVYNDYEDMRINSETNVPESGFNIHATDNQEPVIGVINGPKQVSDETLNFTFYNSDGDTLERSLALESLAPYETLFLYPAREFDLQTFLKGKVGTAKVQFRLNWIFPRLLVGNLQHSPPAFVITHSYYDCSTATESSHYWLETEEQWCPANLMVPFRYTDQIHTSLSFYPIYSPSEFTLDLEIYSPEGECLGAKKQVVEVHSPLHDFIHIDMQALSQELGIQPAGDLAIRVMARTPLGKRIPARIKLAVDIGHVNNTLPCNFCTNMQPFNPDWKTKPSCFRWGPILADQQGATTWIMNSSPEKKWKESAEVHLTFYRESDTNTLKRHITIPPHGFIVLKPEEDEELESFFQNKIGWFTAQSTQPYTTTYYFVEHPSGVVGGDHGF